MELKCNICGGSTDWDSSYGYQEFLVCRKCFDALTHRDLKNTSTVMDFIFTCGHIKRKNKKAKI